jgi:hypothetical protein
MLFFIFTFLVATKSLANTPGVSYQGRIFKPDGSPLEGTMVQFRMQVRSPGSENCLLFEEVQTLNMAGSSGIFSITMNDGTGTRLDAATYQVDRIFANRDVMTLDSSSCAAGTSYTPSVADGRKLIVYFKDETMAAYEAMPIMNLNYVPQAMYALESEKVGTFAVNNILRAVDGSGNPVTAPALDPTQLTNLNSLLAGTSTQYATTTAFNTVQTFAKSAPPTCGAGEVLKSNGTSLSCVTDSAGGAPAYSAITAASATNTIDNTNFAQTWNWSTATTQSPMSMNANALTTGSLMSVATSSASLNSTSGLINVANTGASTSGILARFQSNSTAGSGLTVLTNGNVGIGTAIPYASIDVRRGTTDSSSIGQIINVVANPSANPGAGSFTGSSIQASSQSGNLFNFYNVAAVNGYAEHSASGTLTYLNGGKFEIGGGSGQITNANAIEGYVSYYGTGNVSKLNAGKFDNNKGSSSSVTSMKGIDSIAYNEGTGNVGSLFGLSSYAYTESTSNVTNMYGGYFQLEKGGGAGVVTNAYGVRVEAIGFGTNRYGIYQAGATDPNYFAGNVGIGTLNPSQALEVVGTVQATDFVSTSDRRVKRDITGIEDALNKLMRIDGVTWKWRSNGNSDMGVIAQDVEKVFPELVVTDSNGKKSVKYGNLAGPIIEALKTLKGENDLLAERNEQLTNRVDELAKEIDGFKLLLERMERRRDDYDRKAGDE